jgi:hypothetical protein
VARSIGLQCALVSHGHQCPTVLGNLNIPVFANFHSLMPALLEASQGNSSQEGETKVG